MTIEVRIRAFFPEIDQIEVKLKDDHTSISKGRADGPVGIGGWLAFLILALVLLSPFIGAVRIGGNLASTESQYPNLITFAPWSTYKSAIWSSYLIGSGLSFYAGLGLFASRKASVVTRAKIILWIIGPAASVINLLLIPLVVFGKLESDARLFGALLGTVFFTTLWTAYLSKSRRVKATYS